MILMVTVIRQWTSRH